LIGDKVMATTEELLASILTELTIMNKQIKIIALYYRNYLSNEDMDSNPDAIVKEVPK
jgi:hypothetical protein